MAASGKKNMFNEATRVQMPAMVHLTRLGYTYFGKITEDMAGTVYDPDTNILINVFKEQFARLNPTHAGEAEQTLKTIRQELDNDDIGRSFTSVYRLFRLLDWWILKIQKIIHIILPPSSLVSVTKMNLDLILHCL